MASAQYDAAGRVTRATSVHGGVTTYTYSPTTLTASGPNGTTTTTLDGLLKRGSQPYAVGGSSTPANQRTDRTVPAGPMLTRQARSAKPSP